MENYVASSHLNISSGAKKTAAKVWRTGSRKRPVSYPVNSSWNTKLLLSWVHLMVYADMTFSPLKHKKGLSAKQACLPGPGQHYHSSEIHIIQTVTFSPHQSSQPHCSYILIFRVNLNTDTHYPQSNSWGNVSVVLSVLSESDDTWFLYLDLPTWSAHPILASAKFKSNREYYNRVNKQMYKVLLGCQLMCVTVLSIRPKSL